MSQENKYTYKVIDVVKENENISTLFLSCKDLNISEYKAGQYLTVYFPESNISEGRAYSISSAPAEKNFTITVKSSGEFSKKINALKKGDSILASLPYGYFYIESEKVPLVMIAGGIGITPFRSMIFDLANKEKKREITLFYSVKTFNDLVFKKQFDELAKKNVNFKVKYFITDEEKKNSNVSNSRINATDILSIANDKIKTEFYVCGSTSFTRDMWKELRNNGILEKNIYTEAFF